MLRGVHFDFNKSKIRPGDAAVLDEAAATLKANPDVDIDVNGYCDAIGGDNYNLKLSDRRADAVVDYLVSAGISAEPATSARLRQDQFHRDQRYRRRTRAESPRRTAARTITSIRKAGRSQSRERPALTIDDWRALPVAPASRQNRSRRATFL